ncbi:MAG: hypothetical protein DDG60_11755 [Anaerolineae bacterium]|nr:MAG: hypothetical protein DDG60_11755 [Anaerolineae bacterium]
MRHKILFVINKMTYGGAAKIMAFVANGLTARGHEVHLLSYENPNIIPALDARIHIAQAPPQPPALPGLRRIVQVWQVRHVIRQLKPEVIISFLTYPNLISILAAQGTGIPVIIAERGDPYAWQGWFTRLRDGVYRFANGYIFQTHRAKEYYSNINPSKAIVIPNPAYIGEKPPAPNRAEIQETIVTVGRLELKQKRQDVLIQAFAQIATEYPEIRLVVYGDGEDEMRIRSLIAEHQLEGRILLAGVTKNVYAAIQSARLFVLSSDYEGIPNALIEAMSVGLPCISTDCSPGGAAELIENMHNGILVKTGDSRALAQAIRFMLDHPQQAEQMGQNATKILDRFNPTYILDAWENAIHRFVFRI